MKRAALALLTALLLCGSGWQINSGGVPDPGWPRRILHEPGSELNTGGFDATELGRIALFDAVMFPGSRIATPEGLLVISDLRTRNPNLLILGYMPTHFTFDSEPGVGQGTMERDYWRTMTLAKSAAGGNVKVWEGGANDLFHGNWYAFPGWSDKWCRIYAAYCERRAPHCIDGVYLDYWNFRLWHGEMVAPDTSIVLDPGGAKAVSIDGKWYQGLTGLHALRWATWNAEHIANYRKRLGPGAVIIVNGRNHETDATMTRWVGGNWEHFGDSSYLGGTTLQAQFLSARSEVERADNVTQRGVTPWTVLAAYNAGTLVAGTAFEQDNYVRACSLVLECFYVPYQLSVSSGNYVTEEGVDFAEFGTPTSAIVEDATQGGGTRTRYTRTYTGGTAYVEFTTATGVLFALSPNP